MSAVGAAEDRLEPPVALSQRSGALWADVVAEFELSAAELELLAEACLALDRADEVRATLATEGIVRPDRYGSSKVHPLLAVERQARAFFAQAVKQLGIGASEPSLRSGGKTGPRPRSQRAAWADEGY